MTSVVEVRAMRGSTLNSLRSWWAGGTREVGVTMLAWLDWCPHYARKIRGCVREL